MSDTPLQIDTRTDVFSTWLRLFPHGSNQTYNGSSKACGC